MSDGSPPALPATPSSSFANLTDVEKFRIALAYGSIAQTWPTSLWTSILDSLSLSPKYREAIDATPVPDRIPVECIPPDAKQDVLVHLLSIALQEGGYDARVRASMRQLAAALEVPWCSVARLEKLMALTLLANVVEHEKYEAATKKTASSNRWLKVGIGALAGGGLLVLSGGLAATLLLPAVGTMLAGVASTVTAVGLPAVAAAITTGGAVLVANLSVPAIAALFGVVGTGLSGYRMAQRTAGLQEFEFQPLPHSEEEPVIPGGDRRCLGGERAGGLYAAQGRLGYVVDQGRAALTMSNVRAHIQLDFGDRACAIMCVQNHSGFPLRRVWHGFVDDMLGQWALHPPPVVPSGSSAVYAIVRLPPQKGEWAVAATVVYGCEAFELLISSEVPLVGGSKGAAELYPAGFFSRMPDGPSRSSPARSASPAGGAAPGEDVGPKCVLVAQMQSKKLQSRRSDKLKIGVLEATVDKQDLRFKVQHEGGPRQAILVQRLQEANSGSVGLIVSPRELSTTLEAVLQDVKGKRGLPVVVVNRMPHPLHLRGVRWMGGTWSSKYPPPAVIPAKRAACMCVMGQGMLPEASKGLLLYEGDGYVACCAFGRFVMDANKTHAELGPAGAFAKMDAALADDILAKLSKEGGSHQLKGDLDDERRVAVKVEHGGSPAKTFVISPLLSEEEVVARALDQVDEEDGEVSSLHVAIGVTGFVLHDDLGITPREIQQTFWKLCLRKSPFQTWYADKYSLTWETERQLRVGNWMARDLDLTAVATRAGMQRGAEEATKLTVATLGTAGSAAVVGGYFAITGALMAPLWAMRLTSSAIASQFTICFDRAQKTGAVLADALIAHAQGKRPVTLFAFSLGCTAVFHCLLRLAREERLGIVENVVLMGACVTNDRLKWQHVKKAVAGRLVNVYSTRDWFLGLLCKAAYLRVGGTAGLQRVAGVPGLENVDVSHLVQDHLDYWYRMDDILQAIPPTPDVRTLNSAATTPGLLVPAARYLPLLQELRLTLNARRTLAIALKNRSEFTLRFAKAQFSAGRWSFEPPAEIGPQQCGLMGCVNSILAPAIEGIVVYQEKEGLFAVVCVFCNPFVGSFMSFATVKPSVDLASLATWLPYLTEHDGANRLQLPAGVRAGGPEGPEEEVRPASPEPPDGADGAPTQLRVKHRAGFQTMFLLSQLRKEEPAVSPTSQPGPLATGYIVPLASRWKALRLFLEGAQDRAKEGGLTIVLANRSTTPLRVAPHRPDGAAWHQLPPVLPALSAAVLSIKGCRKASLFCQPLAEDAAAVGQFVLVLAVNEPTVGSAKTAVEIHTDVTAATLKAELDKPPRCLTEYPNITTQTLSLLSPPSPPAAAAAAAGVEPRAPSPPPEDSTAPPALTVCCRHWIHHRGVHQVPWFVIKLLT